MSRRPIENRELVIVAFAADMTERHTLRSDRNWHIFRQTVNGNRIGACDVVKRLLENGHAYYTVPFSPYIADAIAESICSWCANNVGMDERLQNYSHSR